MHTWYAVKQWAELKWLFYIGTFSSKSWRHCLLSVCKQTAPYLSYQSAETRKHRGIIWMLISLALLWHPPAWSQPSGDRHTQGISHIPDIGSAGCMERQILLTPQQRQTKPGVAPWQGESPCQLTPDQSETKPLEPNSPLPHSLDPKCQTTQCLRKNPCCSFSLFTYLICWWCLFSGTKREPVKEADNIKSIMLMSTREFYYVEEHLKTFGWLKMGNK